MPDQLDRGLYFEIISHALETPPVDSFLNTSSFLLLSEEPFHTSHCKTKDSSHTSVNRPCPSASFFFPSVYVYSLIWFFNFLTVLCSSTYNSTSCPCSLHSMFSCKVTFIRTFAIFPCLYNRYSAAISPSSASTSFFSTPPFPHVRLYPPPSCLSCSSRSIFRSSSSPLAMLFFQFFFATRSHSVLYDGSGSSARIDDSTF